jgi:hypothetical protein
VSQQPSYLFDSKVSFFEKLFQIPPAFKSCALSHYVECHNSKGLGTSSYLFASKVSFHEKLFEIPSVFLSDAECHYAECHYSECHDSLLTNLILRSVSTKNCFKFLQCFYLILSVIMPSAIILSVTTSFLLI